MYKTFYAGMDVFAPLLALAMFVLTFVAITVRTMLLRRPADFSKQEALPLRDDQS